LQHCCGIRSSSARSPPLHCRRPSFGEFILCSSSFTLFRSFAPVSLRA
jgi:hypothetical protein